MKTRLAVITVLFLILSAFPASSENIRGKVINNININDASDTPVAEFRMNIEDIFAVTLDPDSVFIKGYEVEIRMSSELRKYGNSFAFIIYSGTSPEINNGIGTYYGAKYDSVILPETARYFIRIPYREKLDTEKDPYTTVFSKLTSDSSYPMMFTILPMMKGFPSSLYSSNFDIRVSPIFHESGILNLEIKVPEGLDESLTELLLDGSKTAIKKEYKLASGEHSLEISIPGGKSINRNFTITAGAGSVIKAEIEKLESKATINVPENTIVYMDGEKLELSDGNVMNIEPGEHLVLFKIGDYKISKKFEIQPGKDCKISLFLDIFVEEN